MQLYSTVNSVQSDEKRLITVNVHFVFLHILTVLYVKTFLGLEAKIETGTK